MDEFMLHRNLIQRVNIGDSLTRAAARYPHKEAIVDGDRRMTYREFDDSVNRIAHALIARGYVRHDALAILSGNSLEFLPNDLRSQAEISDKLAGQRLQRRHGPNRGREGSV